MCCGTWKWLLSGRNRLLSPACAYLADQIQLPAEAGSVEPLWALSSFLLTPSGHTSTWTEVGGGPHGLSPNIWAQDIATKILHPTGHPTSSWLRYSCFRYHTHVVLGCVLLLWSCTTTKATHKWKQFTGACFWFQKFSPLSEQEAWRLADRHTQYWRSNWEFYKEQKERLWAGNRLFETSTFSLHPSDTLSSTRPSK